MINFPSMMGLLAQGAATQAFLNRIEYLCQRAYQDPFNQDVLHRQITAEIYNLFNNTPAFSYELVASNLLSAMAQSPFPVTQLRILGPLECARQFPVIAPVIYATADILLPGWNRTTAVASSRLSSSPQPEWTGQFSSSLPYRALPICPTQTSAAPSTLNSQIRPVRPSSPNLQAASIQQRATPFGSELSPTEISDQKTSSPTSASTTASIGLSSAMSPEPLEKLAYKYGPPDPPAEDCDPFLVNLAKFKNAKTPEGREEVRREMIDSQNKIGLKLDDRMAEVLTGFRGQQATREQRQTDIDRQQKRENLQEDVLCLTDHRNQFMAGVDKLRERQGANRVSDLQQIVDPVRSIVRQYEGDKLVELLDSVLEDEAAEERARDASDTGDESMGDDANAHMTQ